MHVVDPSQCLEETAKTYGASPPGLLAMGNRRDLDEEGEKKVSISNKVGIYSLP